MIELSPPVKIPEHRITEFIDDTVSCCLFFGSYTGLLVNEVARAVLETFGLRLSKEQLGFYVLDSYMWHTIERISDKKEHSQKDREKSIVETVARTLQPNLFSYLCFSFDFEHLKILSYWALSAYKSRRREAPLLQGRKEDVFEAICLYKNVFSHVERVVKHLLRRKDQGGKIIYKIIKVLEAKGFCIDDQIECIILFFYLEEKASLFVKHGGLTGETEKDVFLLGRYLDQWLAHDFVWVFHPEQGRQMARQILERHQKEKPSLEAFLFHDDLCNWIQRAKWVGGALTGKA